MIQPAGFPLGHFLTLNGNLRRRYFRYAMAVSRCRAYGVLKSHLVAVAALLLESRINEQFEAIVTGASDKGTWVRLLHIPVEGKLDHGFHGLDVGDRVYVQLISIDVERGFIDFKQAGPVRH